MAVGGSNAKLGVWAVASGRLVQSLTGHTGEILALSFSPNGQLLASAGADQSVKLWRVESGIELATLTGAASAIAGVTFSATAVG